MINRYPYTDAHELNLDWFLAEFKKVMAKVETLDQTVQEFTAFVTNYFDNLDVQEEINNKLDAMVADGTLSALIQPLFDEYKTEINGIVATQNTTITNINSRTNVLEARMDEFASLPPGSTSGNAELLDIRVMETGETSDSAGNAVRTQIGQQFIFNKTSDLNITEDDYFVPQYTVRNNCHINTSGQLVTGSTYTTYGPIVLLPKQIIYTKLNGSNSTANIICEPDTTYVSTAFVNSANAARSYMNTTDKPIYMMFCSNSIADFQICNIPRKYDTFDSANPKFDLLSKFLRVGGTTTELYFDISDRWVTDNYCQTTPIPLKAGQTIHYKGLVSGSIYAIIKCDEYGTSESGVVTGTGSVTTYEYIADSDCYVKIQYYVKVGTHKIYITRDWNNYYNVDDIRHAVITFTFDDMDANDYKLHDAFIAKGFKCGFGLIADTNIDDAGNQTYLKWQQEGFSMLSHSTDGQTMGNGDMSLSDAIDRFETSKKRLNNIGYEVTGWITPSSGLGSDFQQACRDRYDYAYTSYYGPYPSAYNLGRPPYNTFSQDSATLYRVEFTQSALADLESAVDLAIANKGLMSVYGHAVSFDATQLTKLSDFLDYIRGKIDSYEIRLLAPNEAFAYYYNVRKEDI